jgi:hypothetical protein
MLEDEWPLLPVLYTTIRTIGNPLDMVGSERGDRTGSRLTATLNLDLFLPPDVHPSFENLTLVSRNVTLSLLILAAVQSDSPLPPHSAPCQMVFSAQRAPTHSEASIGTVHILRRRDGCLWQTELIMTL